MAGIWKKSSSLFRPVGFLRTFRTSFPRQDEVRAHDLALKPKPTDFQKRMLVWARIYNNQSDIPDRVSSTKLKKSQDICRVYGMGALIAIGTALSIVVIFYSRHLRNTGQDGITIRHEIQMAKWKEDNSKEEAKMADEAASSAATILK